MSQPMRFFKNVLIKLRGEHLIYGAICFATAAGMYLSQVQDAYTSTGTGSPVIPNVITSTGGVTVKTRLTQTNFLEGSNSQVALSVDLETPAGAIHKTAPSTDFAIVLDTSGSMAEEKKLSYAKAALEQFLSDLRPQDHFAMIRFSTDSDVMTPLAAANDAARNTARTMIQSLYASGSTNIGAGIQAGLAELARGKSPLKKIILLSDGQANVGVVEPQALNAMAQGAAKSEVIVSTIGMGVDFNEVLLTSMSDYGMGEYSYLESTAGLHDVIARYVGSLRSVYAQRSEMIVQLQPGVELMDAGGFPLERGADGRTVVIPTGALSSGAKKNFMVTFRVPTASLGSYSLASFKYRAYHDGNVDEVSVGNDALQFAVVAKDKEALVAQSVDKDLYLDSWAKNNVGRLKRELREDIAAGNKAGAEKKMRAFEEAAARDAEQSKVPLAPAVEGALADLSSSVDDAFRGNEMERARKQKSVSKAMHQSGITDQRR